MRLRALAGVVGLGDGWRDLRLVRLAEPAALVQRVGEDPLELRGERRHARAPPREALGVGQRADRRLHLLVGEHGGQDALLRVKSGSASPSSAPARAPPSAAADVRLGHGERAAAPARTADT